MVDFVKLRFKKILVMPVVRSKTLLSGKNHYNERRLLRSARNDPVFNCLAGLVGVDFRLCRKSTPTNPQYPAKACHCERSEAISIF
jgi:hypothetical protein